MDSDQMNQREEDKGPDAEVTAEAAPQEEWVRPVFFRWMYRLCTQTIRTLALTVEELPMPYLPVSVFIVGAGNIVTGLVNRQITESWVIVVLSILVGGMLYGGFYYFIEGVVYHILIRLCGGRGECRESQAVLMYAKLPGNLINGVLGVSILLTDAVAYHPMLHHILTIGLLISMVVVVVLQLKIQFVGAVHLRHANGMAGFLVFVLIPFFYYVYGFVKSFVGLML